MTAQPHDSKPRVERRWLRAYHPETTDMIMSLVNDHEVRYRMRKNSVLLYPPDGTPPFTVPARAHWHPGPLARWAINHIPSVRKTALHEAVQDGVAALTEAEAETSQEETTTMTQQYERDEAEEAHNGDLLHPEDEADDDLANDTLPDEVPLEPLREGETEHVSEKGHVTIFAVRDGHYRCRRPGCHYAADNAKGLGGHTRMHGDTSSLRTPEALAKATATKRARREVYALRRENERLKESFEYLRDAVMTVTGMAVDEDEVTRLRSQVQTLTDDLAAVTAARDEAVARLALIRESLRA